MNVLIVLSRSRRRWTPGERPLESAEASPSKKYFQHISLLTDTMRTDVKNAGSPKLARRIADQAALEIDRLPVLNIDEELIAYCAGVSETFRNMDPDGGVWQATWCH